jgi:hypothetical protein
VVAGAFCRGGAKNVPGQAAEAAAPEGVSQQMMPARKLLAAAAGQLADAGALGKVLTAAAS